jgi:hypothetical protein
MSWPDLLDALDGSGFAGDYCLEPHSNADARDDACWQASRQFAMWHCRERPGQPPKGEVV